MCKVTLRTFLFTMIVFVLCHQSIQAHIEMQETDDSSIEQTTESTVEEPSTEKQQVDHEEEKAEVETHIEQEEVAIPKETPNMEAQQEEKVDTEIQKEKSAPPNPPDNRQILQRKEEDKTPEPVSTAEVPRNGSAASPVQLSNTGVELLTNTSLTVSHSKTGGQEVITLSFRGYGALSANSFQNDTYAIFQLPPEIARVIQKNRISASYDVPRHGSSGNVLRNQGVFRAQDIQIIGNQVALDFFHLLSLDLPTTYYDFKLMITLDTLPPVENGQYPFRAHATKGIVDLSLLTGGNVAQKTLLVPEMSILGFRHVPAELRFQATPINSMPTTVKRQQSDWALEVRDTRGTGRKWRVTAQISRPLTSVTNPARDLPNALIYRDAQGRSTPLSNTAIEIFRGTTGADPITKVRWPEGQGPLIQVTPSDAVKGDYATSITWTLVDAP